MSVRCVDSLGLARWRITVVSFDGMYKFAIDEVLLILHVLLWHVFLCAVCIMV